VLRNPAANSQRKFASVNGSLIVFLGSTLSLLFESFDGGRDSIERLTQGLLVACQESPEKSLVVNLRKKLSKLFQLFNLGFFDNFRPCSFVENFLKLKV